MKKISLNVDRVSIALNNLYDRFIRKCQIKNLTEKSIESYRKRLIHFIEYYGGDKPIDRISSDTIDGFILWLKDTHTAGDITINSYLRDARALLRYGMECGYIKPFTAISMNLGVPRKLFNSSVKNRIVLSVSSRNLM